MGDINVNIKKVNSYILPTIRKAKNNVQEAYNISITLKRNLPNNDAIISNIERISNDIYDIKKQIIRSEIKVKDKLSEVEQIENKGKLKSFNIISMFKINNWYDRKNNFLYFEDETKKNLINYSEIRNDGYTVQGYTVVDGKSFISAYCKNKKSRIYIYDNETNKLDGYIKLNISSHVGGVAYDEKNDILFVSKGNKVATYKRKELLTSLDTIKNITGEYVLNLNDDNYKTLIIPNNIESTNAVSTMAWSDGAINCFYFGGKGTHTKIDYEYVDGNIKQKSISKSKIKSAVQGATFSNYNDKEYMLLSSSISKSDSIVYLYEKKDGNYELVGGKQVEYPGLEGIWCDDNGNVYGVFEFGDQKVRKVGKIDKIKNNNDIDLKTRAFHYYGSTLYRWKDWFKK